MSARSLLGGTVVGLLAATGSLLPVDELVMPQVATAASVRVVAPPLAGRTIVLDPGHQLGNANFPRRISRLVDAGGFLKACNSTGTATRGGYPEATFSFAVSRRVRRHLVDLGARVVMTRTRNSEDLWGPCIDERGRAGNDIGADLKLSIHGDGSWTGHGFHVIRPGDRVGWTRDIVRPSRRLALVVRRELAAAGLPCANYIAGGDGLAVRGDLGTLNWSDIPVVMVELGNMRAARDARLMTSRSGRDRYARALVRAVVAYFQTRT